MGFTFLAFDDVVDKNVAITYKPDHRVSAFQLMDALGIPYDYKDKHGNGECMDFTLEQISAAQAALTVCVFRPEPGTEGLSFLSTVEAWMRGAEKKDCIICVS